MAGGRNPVRLVVVCGLPGVGKTTVSRAVTERLDARLVRTDVVRKDLFPDPEYTAAERRAVYDEVLSRAREAVANGRSAVLDGTFRTERNRRRARDLSESTGAEWYLLRVTCDEPVVRERIANRTDDESDADFDIYLDYRDRFEPISLPHRTVDNSGDEAATRRRVDEVFTPVPAADD